MTDLSERKREILRRLVEEYVATGQPVGSKGLAERSGLGVSSSTVRYELAELEALGYLTHPHTSAGRVPTDTGYRLYADGLLDRLEPRPARFPLDLTEMRNEVDAALESTTEMLAQVTRLLALVSAPPLATTSVRHVDVLVLQPDMIMVVVITSTGGVTKRLIRFDAPVDAGLADWARAYLNESLTGVRLGTAVVRRRFEDPGLSPRERAFLAALQPAFVEALGETGPRLYVGGAAGLLGGVRADELDSYQRLLEVLETRAAALELLSETLDPRRPLVRVGSELENPALSGAAFVGAGYGLANRSLGAVGLLGPLRMDYDKAIRTVRAAAHELSRLVEAVYEEP
jgi:heat-inducible transcriptional repressor